MAKETKELTIKQKRNKYRKYKRLANLGEYAVLPIPFAALAIANRETWFPDPNTGWQVGIGGTLAFILLGFITMIITENQKKESKVDTGYISLIIGYVLAAVIITLIRNILNELLIIMWVGLSGLVAGLGLDITRRHFKKKQNEEQQILDVAKRNLAVEQATQETIQEREEKKKVKIRIK